MKKVIVTLMILLLATTAMFAAGTKEEGAKKDVTLSVLWFNVSFRTILTLNRAFTSFVTR